MPHTHIIGGGLAGLSAALACVDAGHSVTLHESGPALGGRCRSYLDTQLGCRLDNGNHLLLSGNHATMAYLARIGAGDTLTGPATAIFPFIDLVRGERWAVRPNAGRIPWWVLSKARRVPGTGPMDYLALRKVGQSRPTDTVAKSLPDGPLYRRLIEPLAIAALNTPTYRGSARLLGAVIDETLAAGGAATIPRFPREGLSESFIDPAIATLQRAGATVRTADRITAIALSDTRATALESAEGSIALGPNDNVIIAAPPWIAADLLPGIEVPDEHQAIVNLHFRLDADPGEAGFWGVLGGTTEWVFVKPGVVSVTISAANRFIERRAEDITEIVWPEVRQVLGLPADTPLPRHRVVKEKRATFAATPNQQLRRPRATTMWQNCALAGDWTATGLPATIEGAIRSGTSAVLALRVAAQAD